MDMNLPYNPKDPLAIFQYSHGLIGSTLGNIPGIDRHIYKGKGGLGQMVEDLFFGYAPNSNPNADFADAGVELKCTPLLRSTSEPGFRIKERLVCTMIDYFELAV